MAKGTKKKDGGKSRVPKTVAGVKLPKEVRDVGGGISSWLNSHLGREILAEAIVAAASAAAVALRKQADGPKARRLRKDVADGSTEAATRTKDLVQSAVGVVSDVVVGAAQKLLPDAAEPAAPRGRGRPRSAAKAVAAEASDAKSKAQPRRRGSATRTRPAGSPGPGRPRKPRGAASEPTTEAPKE